MANNTRKEIDVYKGNYSACVLVRKIEEKYKGSDFLQDPMYIALTEHVEQAEWRGKEVESIKSKNDRIEKEEIYDSELYEDDEED
jgi:hypothetical protein